MSKLKQNSQFNRIKQGFTLIELIVVIALMVILATLFLVNYNGTRGARNLKIAQNQMVTNIRKAQSYILSARNTTCSGTTLPAKYYVMKFDLNAIQYSTQSINNAYCLNSAVEIVSLPQGVTISSIQDISPDNTISSRSTLQLAYAAPYGKQYTYNAATDCGSQGLPQPNLQTAVQNPACMLTLADRKVVITLRETSSNATRSVIISGLSGKVENGNP